MHVQYNPLVMYPRLSYGWLQFIWSMQTICNGSNARQGRGYQLGQAIRLTQLYKYNRNYMSDSAVLSTTLQLGRRAYEVDWLKDVVGKDNEVTHG